MLSEDQPGLPVSWLGTEVTCYKKLFPDEKFLGLGEKTGNLDKRGNSFENWNSDVPAYAINHDPLYRSIPFFIGIHGRVTYGIFFDNSFRTKFNCGASTDEQFSSFSAADGEMNYYFFGASTVAGIIRDYTWLTGRMPMPPYWSLGYQQCRWSYLAWASTWQPSLIRGSRLKKAISPTTKGWRTIILQPTLMGATTSEAFGPGDAISSISRKKRSGNGGVPDSTSSPSRGWKASGTI